MIGTLFTGQPVRRVFLIYRKYHITIKYKIDDSYESKMLRKNTQLAEWKIIVSTKVNDKR